MATWGQAFGKTLLQMAPDVQKKMQTNFEDKRNAGAMREIARIALMTDPAQQQAAITELMQRPDTPREIMPYLPKIAEASSAGVRNQQASQAVGKYLGAPSELSNLPADMIASTMNTRIGMDTSLANRKRQEALDARNASEFARIENARAELEKNQDALIEQATGPNSFVVDRNGGRTYTAEARQAQQRLNNMREAAGLNRIQFGDEWRPYAPQSGGGSGRNDDRDVIFRNLFDVDGTILPERVRAAMSLYPQYRDQLRPLMPLSPLAAQTLAAAKAMNPTNPAQALQDAIRIGGSAENINAAIEALESIGGTVEPAQATGQGQPAEGAATPEMPMPKTSNQVRAQMREIGAQLLDLDTQKWRLEQELKNYEQYLTPNPQWNPNAPRVPFSGGSTVPRYIISRETPPDVKARIEILLNDIDALKREIGSLRSRHGMINESGTAISATEWAERVRKNPSSKRR